MSEHNALPLPQKMFVKASIKQWFAASVFDGDDEQTYRASLLNAIISTILIYVNVVVFVDIIGGKTPTTVIFLNIIGFFAVLLLRYWLYRRNVSFTGAWLLCLLFIWVTLASAGLGTIRTPTTAVYLFVVLLAGWLFNWYGVFISTIASSLAVLGLILAENARILPQPDYTVTFVHWFTYTSLFVLTGSFSFFVLQITQKILTQTKKEILERKHTEEALRKSQSHLQAITNATLQSFVLMDTSANILSFNRIANQNARNVFGLELQENDSMFKFVLEPDRVQFINDFNKALEGEIVTVQKPFRSVNGQELWFSFTYNPVRSEDGDIIGVCFNTTDITDYKQAENASRNLLRAVEQSPASIVITDLDANIEYVNPRFTQVTGYSLEEVIGKNPRVLKTDLTPLETHRQLWDTIIAGKEWHGEFINQKKDGSNYYESALISPIIDQNGAITHYLAVKEDITERKRIEAALQRWAHIFEYAEWGITVDSADSKILELLNPAFARMHGYTVEELTGQPLLTIFAPEAWADVPVNIKLAHEKGHHLWDSIHMRKDGSRFPVLIDVTVVRDEHGTILYHVVNVQDITERKQSEEALQRANAQLHIHIEEIEQLQAELREQAIRDPLTGLYNRRYLNETLMRELIRADRENTSLSIIVSDIDHFKFINDTYGHQVGDMFLVEIASLLKKYVRGSDIACRYGGEEFLLVIFGTTTISAKRCAEKIRQKCAEIVIPHEGKDLTVTMSFGVAVYPDHGQQAEDIIIKADKALYQSKHTGRNRVAVWCEAISTSRPMPSPG